MSIELNKESVVKYLEDNYTEQGILEDIDEVEADYLSDDWEDEFEDQHEAYLETGNGEAESHVMNEISQEILKKLDVDSNEFEKAVGEPIWDIIKEVFDVLDKAYWKTK